MTDVAALGYRIDSREAIEAARNLDQMNAAAAKAEASATGLQRQLNALNGVNRQVAMSAQQSAQAFQAFDRARAEVDQLRASYDPLFAASKRYEAAVETLTNAHRMGVISTAEFDRALDRVGQSMLTAGGQANAFRAQTAGATGQLGNMTAQFNDIGVMLAAGQSPLMLALQQGTQINQAFDMMGQQAGAAGGRVALLRGAFMSMLSPANLLTIGIIAGGAALVQWGMNALNAQRPTRDFETALGDLEELMGRVDRATATLQMNSTQLSAEYGTMAIRVRELAIAELELAIAQQRGLVAQAAQSDELRRSVDRYGDLQRVVSIMGDTMYDTTDAARAIARDLGVTGQAASELAISFFDLRNAATVDEQVAAWQRIEELLDQSGVELSELPPELANALRQVLALEGATIDLEAAFRRAADAGATIPVSLPMTTGGIGPGLFNSDGSPALPPPRREPRTGGGGGGGGGQDPFQANLDRLIESLRTEREILDANYEENLAILNDRRAMEILGEEEHRQALLRVEEQYQQDLAAIRFEGQDRALGESADFFGAMASVAQAGGERFNRVARSLAATEALINAYLAASQTLRDPRLGFFGKMAAYATVLAAGLRLVSAIKGGGSGGGGGGAAPTASGSTVEQTPERRVLIDLQGPDWARGILQPLMEQIYEATRDGERVIFTQ